MNNLSILDITNDAPGIFCLLSVIESLSLSRMQRAIHICCSIVTADAFQISRLTHYNILILFLLQVYGNKTCGTTW
jgi:hypothetical protein